MRYRTIHMEDGEWLYFIGRKNVEIRSPVGKKSVVGIDKMLGMSWEEIRQARHDDEYGVRPTTGVTPSKVKEFIEGYLRNV